MLTLPTTLLFLMNEWSSSAGGIQTVNRELCTALVVELCGRGEEVRVACLAQHISDADMNAAKECGVELLAAESVGTDRGDPRVLTQMQHHALRGRRVLAVVGHSKFTGYAARAVRDDQFPGAQLIFFSHMDPYETESLKEEWLDPSEADELIVEREKRATMELECALQADLVFAVGPRLRRRMSDALREEPPINKTLPVVVELLCGMHERNPRNAMPDEPRVLVLGRTDHARLKGVDLFADAAGLVIREWHDNAALKNRPEPRFIVQGGQQRADQLERSLRQRASAAANREVNLIVRPYTQNDEALQRELRRASVLVMPSRAEGFGLVALEACSWGVPVLVTRWSGVGEMMYQRLPAGMAREALLLEMKGLDEPDARQIADKLLPFLVDREWAEEMGVTTRRNLLPVCSWRQAARTFLAEVVRPERPPAEIPAAELNVASYARIDDLLEVWPHNERTENVAQAYCDGKHYKECGAFKVRLHLEIRALEALNLASITCAYQGPADRDYQLLGMRLWLNLEERVLSAEHRLRQAAHLEKGEASDVYLFARFLPEGSTTGYKATDYGEVRITIEVDGNVHTIDGKLDRGGVLLLGDAVGQWQGHGVLD